MSNLLQLIVILNLSFGLIVELANMVLTDVKTAIVRLLIAL